VPELPEVETVRKGLAENVTGRTFISASVHHARVVRRHAAGAAHFSQHVVGKQIESVERRGKYLWFSLTSEGNAQPEALIAHLGMSGQFRVQDERAEHPHLRFDAQFDDGRWLVFLDQRTFGGVALDELVTDTTKTRTVPHALRHIAPDPFEPGYDLAAVSKRMRRKRTEVKRALLDQTLVSGIGNIYADEALWRAHLHPQRQTERLTASTAVTALEAAADVMAEAIVEGGTSFDALYVNVNGDSGYFGRSLAVYGREDEPCLRCGAPIRRLAFTNRSSYVCLRCQRSPRSGTSRRLRQKGDAAP
jgi:formamidopyrimidine-DNA glycosylase